jgi:hypothetical protein
MYHRCISKVWQTMKSQHNSRCIRNIISYHNINHRNYIDRSIFMQGTSYGLQQWSYIDRLDQVTTTNPCTWGGLLPSHGGAQGGDIGEGGEAAGGNPGSGSPSNLRRFTLCFMVSCFSAASSRECLGGRGGGEGSLYRGFRSSPSIWDQDGWHRMLEGKTSTSDATRGGARST